MGLGCLAHQFQAGNPHALESIRRAARLEGASAKKTCAGRLDARGNGKDLLAVLDCARSGDDRNLLAADLGAVGKLDHRAFRTKRAPGQLVGGADAQHVEYTRQHLEFAKVQSGGSPNGGQDRLGCAGCPMYVDARLLHHFDDGKYLFFGSFLLHRYDHCFFPVSGALAPLPWPGSTVRAFLSDANSSLCRARITSMMRS